MLIKGSNTQSGPTEPDLKALRWRLPLRMLLIVAFVSFIPALLGILPLFVSILLYGSFLAVLSLCAFAWFDFKGGARFYASPGPLIIWFFAFLIIIVGGWVGMLFLAKDNAGELLFAASSEQNFRIAGICILIFIGYSFYAKNWISVAVPFYLAIGPVFARVFPKNAEGVPRKAALTLFTMLLLLAVPCVILYRKRKRTNTRDRM